MTADPPTPVPPGSGPAASPRLESELVRQLRAELAQFRQMADAVPAAIAYYEAENRVCRIANRRYAEMFGLTEHTIVGRTLAQVIGEAAAAAIEPHRHRVIEERTVAAYEREVTGADGITRIVDVRLLPHVSEDGVSLGAFVLISDITHHRRAEAALRESEERLAKFMHASAEGIVFHKNGYITDVNPPLLQLLGYTLPEMIGRLTLEFIPPDEQGKVASVIASGDETRYDSIVLHKDGRRIPVEFIVRSLSVAGETQRMAVVRDLTDRREAEQRIERLAHHDALTGLPNRLFFTERLAARLAEARASAEALALMFVDLDHFKRINDSLGHAVGDTLLCTVATRLTDALRVGDIVARFGGDEFLVLLAPRAGKPAVAEVAQRLLVAVGAPLQVGGGKISVTPSVGIAMFPQDASTPEELIQHADQAMYRAKRGGRARVRFYEPNMAEAALAELAMESRLALAVQQHEFVLHFQPQVHAQGAAGDAGRRHGAAAVEALLRWRHPQRGLVAPEEFIPLAENRRQMLPIGAWVMREALAAARRWQEAGFDGLPVSVNLSSVQFEALDFAEVVLAAVQAAAVPGRTLELELTERILMQDPAAAAASLARLRDAGVMITVDDFGTGFTSLAHLKELPLGRLKIDRSFVQGLPADRGSAAVARAIVEMGRALSLAVVAEGVETEAQRRWLVEQGCDAMQGFLIAPPMEEAQLLRWLRLQVARPAAADKA